jgi:quercetin dioxygenase-like cupin family protein
MTLTVRRIVTGHDANGKAIVKTDEQLTAAPRLGHPDIIGCEIWSTDTMPVDNSEESDAAQRKGLIKRYNYVGTGQGVLLRINQFAPGSKTFMHRTETLDYGIILSGECDLLLDSGESVHVKPGDVVVERGTMHAWVNNGSEPCVVAAFLVDASPVTVAGQELGTAGFPGQ